jgi:glycerol-3-phosphate dehydrogenase (NAD(P)+)
MPILAILGSGGWGTALAVVLAQHSGHKIRLWSYRGDVAERLNRLRENTQQLPGVHIPDSVQITSSVHDATRGADAWITAIPTAFLRSTLKLFHSVAAHPVPVISLTKGIEIETFRRPSEIICQELGMSRVVVLSGPSHAEEVARGGPTSLVAACEDAALAAWVQHHFGTDHLRVYTNSDLIGVELAGALKNVLAIAAGICDGLKFGDNAKAALLTRGLVEMQRFGVTHGADPSTFYGLAGIGDLMTTCFSLHGRNRRVGERLAQGEKLQELLAGPQVAEGVFTAKSVYERLVRAGLESPILQGVYRVLYEGQSPREAVNDLLGRPQREESTC